MQFQDGVLPFSSFLSLSVLCCVTVFNFFYTLATIAFFLKTSWLWEVIKDTLSNLVCSWLLLAVWEDLLLSTLIYSQDVTSFWFKLPMCLVFQIPSAPCISDSSFDTCSTLMMVRSLYA